MKKRGAVGAINTLTVVLLILLAIALVFILYTNIIPLVRETADTSTIDALQVNLDLKDAVTIDEGDYTGNLKIIVSRGAGGGGTANLKFIIQGSKGTSVQSEDIAGNSLTINELETKTFVIPMPEGVGAEPTVSVAVVFGDKTVTGQAVTGQAVTGQASRELIKDTRKIRIVSEPEFFEELSYGKGEAWCGGTDINKDTRVNIADLTAVRMDLGTTNSETDVNKDGRVTVTDLVAVRMNLGEEGCNNETNVSCTDSDGGINYYVKGTATFLQTHQDACLVEGAHKLNEYHCINNLKKYNSIIVEVNGQEVEMQYKGCDKTTDSILDCEIKVGGKTYVLEMSKDIDVDGFGSPVLFKLKYGGKEFNFTNTTSAVYSDCDIKLLGDEPFLIKDEYYCPDSCSNGACISNQTNQTTCTDTDAGINYNLKGTATLLQSHEDICSGSLVLFEYFCDGSISKNDFFFVNLNGQEVEMQYKGCDKTTDSIRDCEIKVGGKTYVLEMSKDIDVDGFGSPVLFKLKYGGKEFNFTNTTSAVYSDCDIKLLDESYVVREYKYYCPNKRLSKYNAFQTTIINGQEVEIEYKGCDKSTDAVPTCKLEVDGETKELTMSKVIAIDGIDPNPVLFTLKYGGRTYEFTNTTSAVNSDCKIKLLSPCSDGACLISS